MKRFFIIFGLLALIGLSGSLNFSKVHVSKTQASNNQHKI